MGKPEGVGAKEVEKEKEAAEKESGMFLNA